MIQQFTPEHSGLLFHHLYPIRHAVCLQQSSKSYLPALIRTKQGKDELLKEFMDRYKKTTRQVKYVSQEFILNNLSTTSLKVDPFADNMCARSSKTMGELQERAAKFMLIEEMCAFRRRQQKEATTSSARGSGKTTRNHLRNGQKGWMKPKDLPKPPKSRRGIKC